MKRLLRITLFSAMALAIGAIASIAWLRFVLFRNPCDRADTVLAHGPEGKTIVSRFEACTTIGTSVTDSVDLVSPPGKHEIIFGFEPAYGLVGVPGPLEPSAAWTSPHSLKISIGTVADVLTQRTNIGDLHVTYEIGKNLHMEREVSN